MYPDLFLEVRVTAAYYGLVSSTALGFNGTCESLSVEVLYLLTATDSE